MNDKKQRIPRNGINLLTSNTLTEEIVSKDTSPLQFSGNSRSNEKYMNRNDLDMIPPKGRKRLRSSDDDDDKQSLKFSQGNKIQKTETDTSNSEIYEESLEKTDDMSAKNNKSIQNEVEENTGLKIKVSSKSDTMEKKPKVSQKGPTEKELEAQRQQQLNYLNTFVNISLKYSQFLEKKIDTPQASENSKTTTSLKKKAEKDITKELQYFKGDLRPYQQEGVQWLTVLFENSVNGILADEMGLGKTIQIIALFCHLYQRKVAGPFLVVAPLSTLDNWESEFKRFAPKIPVVRLQGSSEERQQQMKKIRSSFFLDGRKVQPVVVCSYQIPHMEETFLQRFKWQYIVVDEGHRLKNSESQLSKELRALDSVNRTLLTGTPLQNNIKELWALFNFLMPELFKDVQGFSTLIDLDDMKDKNKLLENEARTKVISTIHKVLAPFMLRREKKLVLNDIVPKREVIIYCGLTEMQSYLYRATLQHDLNKLMLGKLDKENDTVSGKRTCRNANISYSDKVSMSAPFVDQYQIRVLQRKLPPTSSSNGFVPKRGNVPFKCPDGPYMLYLTIQNKMMMLKKIVNHPYLVWCPLNPAAQPRNEVYVSEDLIKLSGKLVVLDAMLPKLKADGHKVLIFSTLVMFMDMIEEMLIMRNYEYRRFDGNTKSSVRNENINDFMQDSNVFLFLLSTRAGGLGLNLTAADTVIFMDRDWNPMADLQAQDRCHRIGQTKPVMIYSLITKGTIDEIILNRGDMKRLLEKVVIQEGKFKAMQQSLDDDELKILEELLNKEAKLTKVHSNGLIYTGNELLKILDRSELFAEMKNSKKN